MKKDITPEQALNNLYNAARMAPLKAESHEILRASAEVLLEAIKPKTEANPKKKDEK